MRISDGDRDRVAAVLANAVAEGRLTADEHSERLEAVYAAKTRADIVPIVEDLPNSSAALAPPSGMAPKYGSAGTVAPVGAPQRMIAVFSGVSRKGVWKMPQEIESVNVFGGTELDLREAVLPGKEVRIRSFCILGGMEVIVPPEMHVIDNGIAFLGGRETPPDTEQSASPDAPVLRLSGISVLGGMSVRRKRRKGDKAPKNLRSWER